MTCGSSMLARIASLPPQRAHLTHLYTNLAGATTLAQIEALLPWNVKPLLKQSTQQMHAAS